MPEMSLGSAHRGFALLCLVPIVLWHRAVFTTLRLALGNDAYTHLLLVLPICIAIIYSEWRSGKVRPEPDLRAGVALLAGSILIGVLGSTWKVDSSPSADAHLSMGMLAVVIWWIGSFVACYGTRIAKMSAFPLCFLLLLVPLPEVVVSHIVRLLQLGSASFASLLFAVVRVPVTQDGVFLSVPGLTVEVAQECSSIRSSLMLLIISMVLAQLLLRSVWGKVCVILAAIALSVVKNGLRIFTLSILSVYVDPSYMHGWLHRQGGVLFLALAMAGIYLLIRLVAWGEQHYRDQKRLSGKPWVPVVCRRPS
jgi:exosortase